MNLNKKASNVTTLIICISILKFFLGFLINKRIFLFYYDCAMNLKRAMNDDAKEHCEKINGNKIRKHSTEYVQNASEVISIENGSGDLLHQSYHSTISAESNCSTSHNNLNRIEMNNLNNHNISNGYIGKMKENVTNRNTDSLSYRHIYNSSSSDDDDEHCVYTYKGAEVASDLPESFFYLGMNVPNERERASFCSSPEMDFLEMDFDPGPSNGQDSDSDNASLIENILSTKNDNEVPFVEINNSSRIEVEDFEKNVATTCDENANCYIKKSCTNLESTSTCKEFDISINLCSPADTTDSETPCCSKSLKTNECQVNDENDISIGSFNVFNEDCYVKDTSDDELFFISDQKSALNFEFRKLSEDSDKEEITFIPDGCISNANENQNESLKANEFDIDMLDANLQEILISYEDLLPVDPSYSISAIINVIKLLRTSLYVTTECERFIKILQRKQIPEKVSLVEYLYMRAVQNANEIDLANYSSNIFDNKLYSRFFSTYPKKNVNLLEWLNIWMRKGAIPVITRNIQERGYLSTKNIIHNPWRHNVVYKIESSYVHLLNPIEKISGCVLYNQLSQEPLIYVRRRSILKRWNSKVDLRPLMRANHNRWYNENVLGQVATVIREHNCGSKITQYIRIPSNCNCGITLFVLSENSTLCKEIEDACELPAMY